MRAFVKSLRRSALTALACVVAGVLPAHALTIVRTTDSSVTTLLSATDAAAANAAFDYVAAQLSALYTDPIQVNITMKAVAGTGTLGSSSTSLIGTRTYSQIRTSLTNDATLGDADDTSTTGSLTATDPTGGGVFLIPRAQAKAIGIIASDSSNDGTFSFGAGYTYTYDSANRAVAGKIDFIGVAYHEITEIMGRIYLLGDNLSGSPNYVPFDLYRYTASGVHNVGQTATNVYFSVNDGATNLKGYNSNAAGDLQDWASGANDAFNAFSSSGVLNALTAVDIQVMNVIGYNPAVPTVTSPTSASIAPTTATLGGNVTADNSWTITERGVVRAPTATNSAPIIGGTGVTKITGSGTTGVFTVPVTGLASETGYSYRAYATNARGTGYSSVATFTTQSTNANLSNLAVTTATLSPSFTSGTTSYTSTVANGTTSVTVTPTTAQGNATVTVNGSTVTSGSASGSIALAIGNTTITTIVTAQDGVTTATYTIVVTRPASAPTVTTPTSASITTTTATLGGNVTSDGGATVTERGVVYSVNATNSNPLIGGTGATKVVASGTTGVFTTPVSGLANGTTYAFKAYATNSLGTTYTSVSTFATVSTNADLSNLVVSSATLSPSFASATTGYATTVSNATSSVTVTPTVSQANATVKVNNTSVTSGSASAAISLNYGSNTITTVVTAQDGVTTKTYTVTVTRPAIAPAITTPTSAGITSAAATLGGNVTSDGGATISERGVVYAVTTTNSTPAIGGGGVTQVIGTGTNGVFTVNASALASETGYSFRAYATNSVGTSYTSPVSTFSTLSSNSSLANLVVTTATLSPAFASGTTAYASTVPNTTTSVTVTPTAAQANATIKVNNVSVTSGNASGAIALGIGDTVVSVVVKAQDTVATTTYTITITRPAVVPSIATTTPSALTISNATFTSNVMSDGGASVTERGFVYAPTATNADPQVGGTGVIKVIVAGTTGSYSTSVAGLSQETGYSVRGYAINSVGPGYGSVATFATLSSNANLSSLVVNTATLSPVFASGTTSYTASVPNSTTSVTLTPAVAQVNATVKVNTVSVTSGTPSAPIGLSTGQNLIQTVVTAQNTTTKTYNVTVTRVQPLNITGPTSANITATSATLGGNVTSDGGYAITERGMVYSATSVNGLPVIGGTGVTKIVGTGTTGISTVSVTGLTPGTGYSFRAYATNAESTAYTSVTPTFSTPSNNADLSSLVFNTASLSPVFASGTTSYTATVSNATTSITVSPTAAQATATVTVRNVAVTSGGTSGAIALNVGANLVNTVVTAEDGVTTKTYAVTVTRTAPPSVDTATSDPVTATGATLGGNVASDGNATITERGVVFAVTSVNADPFIGGTGVTKVVGTGTTGVFTVDVTGLTPATGYSFKAYATNSQGTGYSTPADTFTTPAAAPGIGAPTSTGITATAATLGGTVTSDGGATITQRGVVYALSTTNPDPPISGTGVTKLVASGTTGTFTINAASLTAGTGYAFKAYALNSEGTTYTAVATFSTPNAILDVDGNGSYDASTDGQIVVRYLFGMSGDMLKAGALGANAVRVDPLVIESYLASIMPQLDIDGDGHVDALTDGLLIARYMLGLRGSALVNGALGADATRNTAQIEAYLDTLMR